MNTAERAHIDFIKDYLRQGLKREAIKESFVKRWTDMSIRTFDRRLQKAVKEYEAEQRAVNERVVDATAAEVQRQSLMFVTVEQRKDILSKIALGQHTVKKPVWTPEGFKAIPCEPNHKDIQNAIAELNKMCNDYPSTKLDIESTNVNTNATTIIQEFIIGAPLNGNGNGAHHNGNGSNGTDNGS